METRPRTPEPTLALIVLRVADPERSVAFYETLGLAFVRHRHGDGPEHHSASLPGGTVFELYPQKPGGPSSAGARIGFRVADVDDAVAAFADAVVSLPRDSPWGRRAILSDPDDHRVELTEVTR